MKTQTHKQPELRRVQDGYHCGNEQGSNKDSNDYHQNMHLNQAMSSSADEQLNQPRYEISVCRKQMPQTNISDYNGMSNDELLDRLTNVVAKLNRTVAIFSRDKNEISELCRAQIVRCTNTAHQVEAEKKRANDYEQTWQRAYNALNSYHNNMQNIFKKKT